MDMSRMAVEQNEYKEQCSVVGENWAKLLSFFHCVHEFSCTLKPPFVITVLFQ